MMIVMKRFGMLFCSISLLAATNIRDVRTVYVFPMRNGMDQHLASALTSQHLFRVVLDPKAADAVLTDRIGPEFEQMFDRRVLDQKAAASDSGHTVVSRSRGTLFLVDKSKQVLWSGFSPLMDTSPKGAEKAARRSVERIQKDLFPQAAGGN